MKNWVKTTFSSLDLNPWLLALGCGVFMAQNPDHYRDQTFLMLSVLGLFLAIQIVNKTHLLAGCLFFWCLLRALEVFAVKESPYAHYGADTNVAFSFVSANAAISLVGVSMGALLLRAQDMTLLLEAFSWLGVCNALVMIFHTNCGILDNAAMDASLNLTLLPLLFRKEFRYKWVALIPVFSIFKSGSSTGFIGLILMSLIWFFYRYRTLFWLYLGELAILIVGALIIKPLSFWSEFQLPFLKHGLMFSSGRSVIWTQTWAVFKAQHHYFKGLGTGTFALHGPFLHGDPTQVFIWLHNDFLQIGYEQGLIAFSLALALFYVLCKKSFDKAWLFSAISSFGFTMLTQMPLRHIFSAFYGAFLIRKAFEEKK